jgi:PKD repeat protein
MWIFGDGTTSTVANPTHPFTNAGTYAVQLIAYYSNNVSDTVILTIEVLPPPAFSFTKLNDSICPDGFVSFSSSVSYPSNPNGIASYSWDFGDGGVSQSPNPTYQYKNMPNQPVLYHVSLTVTDTNGCSQKITQSNYIYVKPKPVPEFNVDKPYFCYPDTPGIVQFTNLTSVTSNNTYSWIFSDGGSSTLENPSYSFSNVGSYAVSLMATSPEGCSNTISKSNVIEVIDFKIQRTVSDTILCSFPSDVTFRGLNGSNVSYTWSFGDGTTGNTAFNAITHTYDTSGTYPVTLIANYRNGTCFAYDTMTIHVYDTLYRGEMSITDSLMCDFEYDSVVLFQNVTPYPTTDDFGFGSTVWFFGDGNTATGDSVYHIYNNATNRYRVIMQTVTPYGCVLNNDTGEVRYHSYIPPYMRLDTLGGCVPMSFYPCIFFQDTGDFSPMVQFIWDWGDGSPLDTSEFANGCPPPPPSAPRHTYTDTGVFEVYVTMTNTIGCSYTVFYDIAPVGIPPAAWFTYEFQEQCYSDFFSKSPLFVQAFDSLDVDGKPVAGAYANKWLWLDKNKHPTWLDFVDTAGLRVDDTGYIQVRMVPHHNHCAGDTITIDSVAYSCPPRSGFTTLFDTYPVFCGYPVEIEFNNISVGATSYRWFFGDAQELENQSTLTDKSPTYVYQQANPFLFKAGGSVGIVVRLVAYNDDSVNVNSPTYNRCKFCADTSSLLIFIPDDTMKFTHSPTLCQENTVYFYDSSIYNASIRRKEFSIYPDPLFGLGSRTYNDPFDDGISYFSLAEGYPVYFNKLGNYTAILTTVDDYLCIHLDTITFSIYPRSVASFTSGIDGFNFTSGKDTLCANNSDLLYFRDLSYTDAPFDTAEIVSWLWKIHDDSSALQNPTIRDTVAGMHDVELRIVNEYGCQTNSIFKDQVLVNKITPSFSPSKNVYCNHGEVEFNNLSYISPYEYNEHTEFICSWDFGDGSPVYTQAGIEKVYHTYHLLKVPDTVDVTLIVFTADGSCFADVVVPIIIMGPKASFTDDGRRFPCPDNGRKVQFHSTSTGLEPILFYWNFGDSLSGTANESNLSNSVHDYFRAGTFDVTLIVEDAAGCMDTLFQPEYVFIDGPVGDFTYGELSGCLDRQIIFIPVVSNVDTIIVNPDKASEIVRSQPRLNDTIVHVYQTPGAYLPYFYLIKWTDNNGIPTQCKVQWEGLDTIYVVDISPDFETELLYCSQLPATFLNTTTFLPDYLEIDTVLWRFGNGDSSNTINGHTQYNAIGTYPVELTVQIMNCSQQISKMIDVIELPDTIHIQPDSANICGYDLEVRFTAAAADTLPFKFPPQYWWIFDDNDTIKGNPAFKTFGASGNYPYQLMVHFGMANCIKTWFDTITVQVYTPPVAEFEAIPPTVNYGQEIQFMDRSIMGEGNLTVWHWDFGDSTNSNEKNPAHAYHNTSGYVPVILKIKDEFGCEDSIEHEVLILERLEFPNLFTPIGLDDKKYVFKPLEEKGYFKEFQIKIYNRWGNFIWGNSCIDPGCPDYSDSFWWDGYNKGGRLVEDGVYYWVVYAIPLSETDVFTKNGSVTVINKGK